MGILQQRRILTLNKYCIANECNNSEEIHTETVRSFGSLKTTTACIFLFSLNSSFSSRYFNLKFNGFAQ